MLLKQNYINYLFNILPLTAAQEIKKENILVCQPDHVNFFLFFLKNHIGCQYKILSCISAVDLLGKSYRFAVCYDLLSITFNTRLRLKTFLNEVTPLKSCVEVYPNSNWWEREVWDLFGIFFENHPDLRRILTDYGFEGSPMRKDFPLYGFVELRYDESQKRIVVEPIEFSQEFRSFDFETPW